MDNTYETRRHDIIKRLILLLIFKSEEITFGKMRGKCVPDVYASGWLPVVGQNVHGEERISRGDAYTSYTARRTPRRIAAA